MRAAAHAAPSAVHSHQHGRHAAPPPGELMLLAFWATLRNFRLSQAALRWEPPATGALLALTPFVSGALAAAVLHSFDGCYGELRDTLAVCLIGAVASGTSLLCWSFDAASMRRSISYAVAAGLGAAGPLVQFG